MAEALRCSSRSATDPSRRPGSPTDAAPAEPQPQPQEDGAAAATPEEPCFAGRPHEAVEALRRRFHPEISDGAAADKVHELIDKATNNWRTAWYDEYQRCCVGIY